jgi:acyl-CoA thioesterase-1
LDALGRVQAVLAEKPDVVIVEFGANDILDAVQGGKVPDLAGLRDRLGLLVEALDGGAAVYLVKFYSLSMISDFPGGDGELPAALDGLFASLEAEYHIGIIDGIWDGIWGDVSLMSDGTHPNAAGYRVMADNYVTALAPFLKEQGLLR